MPKCTFIADARGKGYYLCPACNVPIRSQHIDSIVRECMPPIPLTQQAYNFTQAILAYVKEPGCLDKESYERRLSICNSCQYRKGKRCGKCGCILALKAKAIAFHCPMGLWPGDTGVQLPVPSIGIGMITAPRAESTIEASIKSLREAGFKEQVHIFKEPGTVIPKMKDCTVHENQTQLGAFLNYRESFHWMQRNIKADYILMLEDDVEIFPTAREALIAGLRANDNAGYFSLYTPTHNYRQIAEPINGWNQANLGDNAWGALALCIKREHTFASLTGEAIDQELSKHFGQKGIDTFYHIPSLAKHIGKTSTLGHRPKPGHRAVRPRVGFITPCMAHGGAERWLLGLAKTMDVEFSGTYISSSRRDASIIKELSSLMPIVNSPKDLASSDIIIVWGNNGSSLSGFQCPKVFVSHGSDDNWTKNAFLNQEPWITHLAAVSKAAANCFGNLPWTVIENGIDTSRLDAQRELLPRNKTILGFIGRLSSEKNPDLLIEAMQYLDGCIAIFVGDGQERKRLESFASENIRFFNAIDDVGSAYRNSDIYVNTSDSEGYCLAIMEAMYCGCRIISKRVGALKDHDFPFNEIPMDCTPKQLADAIRDSIHYPIPKIRTIEEMGHDWTKYIYSILQSS